MKNFLHILVAIVFVACKGGSESPKVLAKEMMSAVGDSQKMLSLMPSNAQLEDIMKCDSGNDMLSRLQIQRQSFDTIKDQKPGFKLVYQSSEIDKLHKLSKGDFIPDSLSKCKAIKPLVFAEITGQSHLIDAQTKIEKETKFTAVQIDGRWLLFLLKTNYPIK